MDAESWYPMDTCRPRCIQTYRALNMDDKTIRDNEEKKRRQANERKQRNEDLIRRIKKRVDGGKRW